MLLNNITAEFESSEFVEVVQNLWRLEIDVVDQETNRVCDGCLDTQKCKKPAPKSECE